MKKFVLVRQCIFILILSACTLKLLFLPSLLAKDVGRDMYLYVFFMMGLDFLVLTFLVILSVKYPNKTFYELVLTCFGKVVAKIVMALIFVFFILKSWATFQTNFSYLNQNLYTTINWAIFSIPMVIVLFYVSKFGITALARVVEILMPIILVGMLFSLIIGIFKADFTNLLPFMENGISAESLKIFRYSFWFGDYVIYIAFMGHIKEENKSCLKILSSIGISILVVCFFIASFYAVYGFNSVCHSNAISDMLQILPSTSDIGSFDWILVLVWDTALFLYLALYIFGALYCLDAIFGKKYLTTKLVVILLIVSVVNVISNFDVFASIKFAQNYLSYFSIFVQYVLPIVILIFSFRLRGSKNNDKIPLEK